MTEPGNGPRVDEQADAAARELGRAVLGRDLTAEEFAAMSTIFRAAGSALHDGFIARLAAHVQDERATENVEEFFGGTLRTD